MTRLGRGFRIASLVMGVLFVLSTLVQFNDPDPLRWIALYGVAAALSFAAASTTLPPLLPAVHAAIAFVWAALLFPSALETSFGRMFGSVRMMSPEVEVGREDLGLAIVAVWMAVLAWVLRRAAREPRAAR